MLLAKYRLHANKTLQCCGSNAYQALILINLFFSIHFMIHNKVSRFSIVPQPWHGELVEITPRRKQGPVYSAQLVPWLPILGIRKDVLTYISLNIRVSTIGGLIEAFFIEKWKWRKFQPYHLPFIFCCIQLCSVGSVIETGLSGYMG